MLEFDQSQFSRMPNGNILREDTFGNSKTVMILPKNARVYFDPPVNSGMILGVRQKKRFLRQNPPAAIIYTRREGQTVEEKRSIYNGLFGEMIDVNMPDPDFSSPNLTHIAEMVRVANEFGWDIDPEVWIVIGQASHGLITK